MIFWAQIYLYVKNKQDVLLLTIFRHLPFIGLFALILLRDNDLLFFKKYFGY